MAVLMLTLIATLGSAPDDAANRIELALRREAEGDPAGRRTALELAVEADPDSVRARSLLGLLRHEGEWLTPEALAAKLGADDARAAALRDYHERRETLRNASDYHFTLGLWCERKGLKDEAEAHFLNVVRQDPEREAAWRRLGAKKKDGFWATDARLAELKAERDRQAAADRKWRPTIKKYKGMLADKSKVRRDEALAKLAAVEDPRVVPAIWSNLVAGSPATQGTAVDTLRRVEGPAASQALAALAVFGDSEPVRAAAVEALSTRDPREFLAALIGSIRRPLKYEVRPVGGPDSPGGLFVEGERFNERRVYAPSTDSLVPWLPLAPTELPDGARLAALYQEAQVANGLTAAAAPGRSRANNPDVQLRQMEQSAYFDAMQRNMAARATIERNNRVMAMETAESRRRLTEDVARIEAVNARLAGTTARTLAALKRATGEELGDDPKVWVKWLAATEGFVQVRPAEAGAEARPKPKRVGRTSPTHVLNVGFAAKTPIRALEGPRDVETIRVGDHVLTQNPDTGALGFRPVVAIFHAGTNPALRIDLGGEAVVATPLQRFWKIGRGWVMARDLKRGDVVRTPGSTRAVRDVSVDRPIPVFQVEVAEAHGLFVGRDGVLVHDNSMVRPVSQPFDVPTNRNRR